MFKVEKVLDLSNTEFAKAFQELIIKYSHENIELDDNKRMFTKIPIPINDKIVKYKMSILTKYVRSEKYLNECIEMVNKYVQDQSENPSLHYIENIYEIIKLQIISSREAWEILKLLINERVKNHKELAKWCNGKYKNSNKILKGLKKFYDIRGDIEHPSKNISTTILQKIGDKVMYPTATFNNETHNLFDLAVECLNITFLAQRMFIELGFYYSKYVFAISEGGSIFINQNFDSKSDMNHNDS